MKKQIFINQLKTGVAPAILGLAMISAPAYAQDADDADGAENDVIVVTGSLISDPNLERSSPVNVTGEDEVELKLSTNAEELIRDVPGLVTGIGSNANNGNNGTATIDLRALGSNRNIGLLDGTRVVPNDLSGQFDLNNVPLALVERVEVLTGGASTTYGADAIAGVVNFITKQDFAGFEAELSNQITEVGDGNIFRADVTLGANFDDGRGNVVLSLGYQERDAVFQGDREISLFGINSFNGARGGSTTSVPGRFSVPGSGNLQVDPGSSTLVAGYLPFNFNPFNIYQTPYERFNIYSAGRYEITDNIEVYARGLFSKNNVSTIIAPSGSFGSNQTININNPFIAAGQRDIFCANNDFDPNTTGVQTLDPATCLAAANDPNGPTFDDDGDPDTPDVANPNYRTFTTNVRRRTVEVGPRLGDYGTTLFDYKLGFRGGLTDTIDWDIFGAYGESQRVLTQDNYVLNSRLGDTLQTIDGTTCVTSSAAGCAPANVFGQAGDISEAAANYLRGRSTTERRASLAQFRALINGDAGFSSPWASDDVGFAIGGEYRKNTGFQQADALAETPGELGGAGGAAVPIRGAYDVYEAFGELILPIVQDKPFFEDLTLEAGIRYSDYTLDAPSNPGYSTTTWKVGGSWSPGAGVKFRGGFNRAVRAPNISELFTPVSTQLTNLNNDPCAGNISGADLIAVCLAQGAQNFQIGVIPPPVSNQANITTGGNINLQPETADTYTVGFVWQPDFVPGLDFSLDYYNIKITDAITVATPGDIISACFGNITSASATDPACTSFGRNPSDGGLSGDPAVTAGLFGALSNLGKLSTDGVDFILNYKRDIGFADLSFGLSGNWTNSTKFQATPTSINRECVGFYSVNCSAFSGAIQPEWTASARTTLSFDTVDVSLLWRYVDAVEYEPLQFAADVAAAELSNVDEDGVLLPVADQGCPDFQGADAGGCLVEPGFRSIDAAHYFDLTARWQIFDNLQLTFIVQNLFDKSPPLVGNDVGSTTFNSGNTYPSTYDALGRRYGASVKLSF